MDFWFGFVRKLVILLFVILFLDVIRLRESGIIKDGAFPQRWMICNGGAFAAVALHLPWQNPLKNNDAGSLSGCSRLFLKKERI